MARPKSGRAIIVTGLAGVGAGILVFVGISALIGSGGAKSKLGSDVFRVGEAKEQAEFVARHGPLLFADPLEKGRDIYVVHLGEARWTAFNVHPPGQAKSCTVKWEEKERMFRDSCTARTYPMDGTGLIRYRASVEKDGDLVVNLNQPVS